MSDKSEKRLFDLFGIIKSPINTGVFFLCFVLSFLFWGLLQLSEEHTGTYNFKVEFSDLPPGYEIDPSTPQFIDVTLKTYGFKLLTFYANKQSNTITIPVNEIIGRKSINKKGIYLQLSAHNQKIAEGIGPDIKVLAVKPDSILLKTSAYQSKKVAVRLHASLQFEPEFTNFGNMIISPDSVLINGVDTVLSRIESVNTEHVELKQISSVTSVGVGITLPEGVSRSNPDFVKVEIPAHRFTEKKIRLKLKTDVENDSLRVSFFPSEVTFVAIVANEFYKIMNDDEFQAYCTWDEILRPNHEKLKVHHKLLTKLARVNKIIPSHVDYIIHRK